jgi:predicted ATPase
MERIFNEPQCRLLTLTGMGGIGKTRLAIEFASRQRSKFSDGVHYVPLVSINSAELIVPAIADVLEFSFSGPVDLQAQLFTYLAQSVRRPALLVLDNLEHLLAQSSAAAELVAEILQRFSNIKILCTSRERLSLHGEWTYELHGLSIPPSEFTDSLEDYSAASLFMERARQIRTEFDLTEPDKPALVRICHLVEGIPLAIELAAAWVGLLSCREIAEEIEKNIDFLTTSMRDAPERHRSLKATFDHSWRLLSDVEREALSRLSVFHGGFDRFAAEKVGGATLSLLASLVSKSLVRRTEDGRYDLHEVIRQHALAHLREDETRQLETCDLHCEYYLNLAAEYERKLKSASQQTAVHEMTVEFDNMRAAWVWGIHYEKFESLGRAVRSFGWYFEVAGLIHEGIDQLELLVQALTAKPRNLQMDKTLGSTLVQQGLLCFRSGQFIRAQELYKDAIFILRSANARALLADGLIFSGTIMHLNGDYLDAKNLIEEGLIYAQEADDRWFSAYGIYNLGHVESMLGEYQKGYEQMQEGMKLWRELGDPHSISLGLNFLVETQIALGQLEEAIAAMRESIALCERTRNRWGMGTAYRYLGLVTLVTGRCSEAQEYLQESLETFGEYFKGWDIARTLMILGKAQILSGDQTQARKTLLDALRLSKEVHSRPLMLEAVLDLASLGAYIDPEQAAGWLMLISAHPAATQETKDRARQQLQILEEQVGIQQMQAIREKVSQRTLESIVDRLV